MFEGFERIESLGIMRGLVLNFLYLPDSVDVSNPVSASRRRRSFQEPRCLYSLGDLAYCERESKKPGGREEAKKVHAKKFITSYERPSIVELASTI